MKNGLFMIMFNVNGAGKQTCECSGPMAKAGSHPMKLLLYIWCDCTGIIHFEHLLDSEAITAKIYCDQLANLNAVIQEIWLIIANWKCHCLLF